MLTSFRFSASFAALLAFTVLGACRRQAATPAPAPVPAPPWSAQALSASAIPAIYGEVWRKAANRSRCALIAPASLDSPLDRVARPRAATFSGGWAVAYDDATRSVFGVAGTGASAWSRDVYQGWPYKRVYADSSRVGYGPEGGTGPNWLAYIQIPGQDCLYHVWSRRGREHLEMLVTQLRFARS